jgi:hypothetical protein
MRTPVRRLVTVAVAILVACPVMTAPVSAAPRREPPGKPVTVMSRNLYLGANIQRPVDAALDAVAAGGTPEQVVAALATATHVTREIVDDTDFTVRVGLLADEIVATRPDLVGLQEVALWRSGPLDLGNVGVTDATTVDYDFLAMLLDALHVRGASYDAVSIGDRADVEAPSFGINPSTGALIEPRDVRLTMRDVILARTDNGLRVTGAGDRVFAHNLVVPLLGRQLEFDRGFQWVDVRLGSERFRFVNSHFEAFSSDLALAQAAEVVQAMPTDRTVVFVCDCNSDPLDDSIKPRDTQPHKAAYDLITGAGGFTDQWLEWAPAEEGWTSGLSERVKDTSAAGFDHRIDMVFGRTSSGDELLVDRGQVTGTDLSDRDPATGLWPSDHGGVVLRLRGL